MILARNAVLVVVLVCLWVVPFANVGAQPAGDRQIVPGERIGSVQLIDRLADLQTRFGPHALPSSPGLWDGTQFHEWPAIGLAVVTDVTTRALLWISVCACGSNPWADTRTSDGLGVGTPEAQVLQVMGTPSRTFADTNGKSLWYAAKGIAFLIQMQGPAAGSVGSIRIFWKVRGLGDTLAVPGRRIGSISLGMPEAQARAELGHGYIVQQRGSTATFYWPHLGVIIFLSLGRVNQVVATLERHHEDLGVRYRTVEGAGIGSRTDEVRQAFGEPPERARQGSVDFWIYPSRGIAFVFGLPDRPGVVSGVNVFTPR